MRSRVSSLCHLVFGSFVVAPISWFVRDAFESRHLWRTVFAPMFCSKYCCTSFLDQPAWKSIKRLKSVYYCRSGCPWFLRCGDWLYLLLRHVLTVLWSRCCVNTRFLWKWELSSQPGWIFLYFSKMAPWKERMHVSCATPSYPLGMAFPGTLSLIRGEPTPIDANCTDGIQWS